MYLGKFFLSYLQAFPLCLLFLIRHAHWSSNSSLLHSFSYWVVSALWFLTAWQLANWQDGPWSLYENRPYIRRIVAAAALPIASILSGPGHYRLVEGQFPPGGPFWAFFCIVLLSSGISGYVCTGLIPHRDRGQREAEEAGRAFKPVIALLVFVLGGLVAFLQYMDLLVPYIAEVRDAPTLVLASIFLGVCLVGTILQPIIIQREIEHRLAKKKNTASPAV
ncbi:MAG: hypothetical protein ACRD4U_09950 [Candidatus Acidiferrales bacterium]